MKREELTEADESHRGEEANAQLHPLQSELERMLAQLSEGSLKREEEEEDGEELDEEDEEEEEEEEDGEDEEGTRGTTAAAMIGDMDQNSAAPLHQPSQGQQRQQTASKRGKGADSTKGPTLLPNGKKTKGRVKIKMEYIGNKLRRYTTFSKRKTGIMKKANELSTLTGTQVMLLVASETGHVYAFATSKLKPMIFSEPGKQLIQSCLNTQDDQVVDPLPTKTEFTFEPPALGLAPTAGGSTVRKRKATTTAEATAAVNCSPPTMVQHCSGNGSSEAPNVASELNGPNKAKKARKSVAKGEQQQQNGTEKTQSVCTMDAQQLQRTLKEALKAAADQRQRQQQTGGKKNSAGVCGGKERAQPKTVPTSGQPAGNNLMAALLPLLLQGLVSPRVPASSAPASPLSAASQRTLPHYRPSPLLGSTRDRKQTQAGGSMTEPPILYQMPQGVVYATGEGSEEQQQEEDEEQRHPKEIASCMAAMSSTSSASSSSSSTSSTCQQLSAISDDTATGNALQQLLAAGLLPFAAANLTAQQIFASALGTGKNGASGSGDD